MKIAPFSWLALSFFGYFCAYGIVVPFLPVWLNAQHYEAQLIGIMLSSAYFFRFVGGILFAAQIKQPSHLLPMLRLLAGLSVVITLAMYSFSSHFWLLFILIALFSMVNSAGIPITDTLASTWAKQVRLDYGKARLIGSLAFTFSVIIFGNLIESLGTQYIMPIMIAVFIGYSLVQLLPPVIAPQSDEQSAVSNSPSFLSLLKNPDHRQMLLSACLIQGSHAGYYVYSVLYWSQKGIAVGTISLLWGLAVAAEILLFFFSSRLLKNWKISNLLTVAAVAAAVRWGIYGSTNELWLLILLQTFHSLTFAVNHFAMVKYIGAQPQSHIAKLQSLYNGLASSAAVGIMTAVAGLIFPHSPEAVFLLMAVCACGALLFIPRKLTMRIN